jgi:hypothetical protein
MERGAGVTLAARAEKFQGRNFSAFPKLRTGFLGAFGRWVVGVRG